MSKILPAQKQKLTFNTISDLKIKFNLRMGDLVEAKRTITTVESFQKFEMSNTEPSEILSDIEEVSIKEGHVCFISGIEIDDYQHSWLKLVTNNSIVMYNFTENSKYGNDNFSNDFKKVDKLSTEKVLK